MKRFAAVATLLIAAYALGDTTLKNASIAIGPVQSIDCVSDGGLICYRDAGTNVGSIICAPASSHSRGCVTTTQVLNATTAAVDLYVDGALGSDSNACTSSGASACATCQGALDKLPFFLNHQVTVRMTGATLAGCRLWNHVFNPADMTVGAGVRILGDTPTNVTPTTGSATGTVASITTDAVNFHVLTVTAAGWTTDNFAGAFLVTTGGTGSGQTLPIISNTATTITVAGFFFPAPVGASTTFAIRSPATIITSAANTMATATSATGALAGLVIGNIWGPRAINTLVSVEDIGFTGSFRAISAVNAVGVTILRCRGVITNNQFLTANNDTNLTLSKSTASTGTVSAISVGASPGDLVRLAVSQSFLTSATASQVGTVLVSSGVSLSGLSLSSTEVVNTSSSGSAVYINGSSGMTTVSSSRLRCSSASSNFGLYMPGIVTAGLNMVNASTVEIVGCGTGLFMRNRGQTAMLRSSVAFTSNTLAMLVYGGAELAFELNVPADTSNTTFLKVGGTTTGAGGATFTRTEFLALDPINTQPSYVELPTGTRVFTTPG